MAKSETQSTNIRIGQIAPAESVAIPQYREEDIVGMEFFCESYEFKSTDKGNDFVTLNIIFTKNGKRGELSSFQRAIISQLSTAYQQQIMQFDGKVVAFGRYYALA